MRRWLLFLVLLVQPLLGEEPALPPRPVSRISDQSELFDRLSKRSFSRVLAEEYAQTRISIYVVTMKGLSHSEAGVFANRLRDAWITDTFGVIILYGENTDQIYLSLSKAAFRKVSAAGRLEKLASEIDVFNKRGPELSLPKAAEAILDRMRDKPVVQAPAPTPETVPTSVLEKSISVFFCLVMGLLVIYGIFRFVCFCRAHTVFTPSNSIPSGPVTPILGSVMGGVNTAEGKY